MVQDLHMGIHDITIYFKMQNKKLWGNYFITKFQNFNNFTVAFMF